jgi:CheY-like chemotaxis protein
MVTLSQRDGTRLASRDVMTSVLIVDDEFGLAELAGELLSLFGYSVSL